MYRQQTEAAAPMVGAARGRYHDRMTLLALLVACTGPTDDSGNPADSNADSEVTDICGDTAVFDAWSAGMEKPGDAGSYMLAIVDAAPAPPDKGDNTWTLHVATAGGAPVTDATVIITPFMPAHGHGTNPATVPTTATSTPGDYQSDPFNLFMGGEWQLTVTATAAGTGSDSATFTFCIES